MSCPAIPHSGKHHNEAQWEVIRPRFAHLYSVEGKTLKEVMQILGERYGFWASVKMYKTRVTKWKLEKKNKERELLHVLRKVHEVRGQGTEMAFRIRGKHQTMKNVEDHFRRKGIVDQEDLLERLPASPTPSVLSFTTDLAEESFDLDATLPPKASSSYEELSLLSYESNTTTSADLQWTSSVSAEPASSSHSLRLMSRPREDYNDINQDAGPTSHKDILRINKSHTTTAPGTANFLPSAQLYQLVVPPTRYKGMESYLLNIQDLCFAAFKGLDSSIECFPSIAIYFDFRLLFLETRNLLNQNLHPEALYFYEVLTNILTIVLHRRGLVAIVLIYQWLSSRQLGFQEPLTLSVIRFLSEMAVIKLNNTNPISEIITSLIENHHDHLELVESGARCVLDYARSALSPLHPYARVLADRCCHTLEELRRHDEAERLEELASYFPEKFFKVLEQTLRIFLSSGRDYLDLLYLFQELVATKESCIPLIRSLMRNYNRLPLAGSNDTNKAQMVRLVSSIRNWFPIDEADYRTIRVPSRYIEPPSG